ncbi:MAG: hypothetical protein AAF721_10570 [Myxococcota bacterium]
MRARLRCSGPVLLVAFVGCFDDPSEVDGTMPATTTAADGDTSEADSDGSDGAASSGDGRPGSTGSVDTTADQTTEGMPPCDPGQACIPPAAADWTGPVLVLAGVDQATPAMCPPGTSMGGGGGELPLTADPLECVCDPGVAECNTAMFAFGSSVNGCGVQQDSTLLGPGNGDCVALVLSGDYVGTNGTGGACPEPVTTGRGSDPVFDAYVTVCEPDDPVACGDGWCAPTGPIGQRCIAREGPHDCPPGPYAGQRVVFQSVADDRACVGCTTTLECGQIDFYDDPACGGMPFATVPGASPDPSCQETGLKGDIPPESVQWSGSVGCSIDVDTMPVGEATPTDPLTLCCLE